MKCTCRAGSDEAGVTHYGFCAWILYPAPCRADGIVAQFCRKVYHKSPEGNHLCQKAFGHDGQCGGGIGSQPLIEPVNSTESEKIKAEEQYTKMQLAGGKATSSKIPPFKYIPLWAAEALARVFEEGVESHKDKAWNALSESFHDVNISKDWVLERLSHNIHHSLKLIMEIAGQCKPTGENHSGAILFAGSVAACYVKETGPKDDGQIPIPKQSGPFRYAPILIGIHEQKGSLKVEKPYCVYIGDTFVNKFSDKEDANALCRSLERSINGR